MAQSCAGSGEKGRGSRAPACARLRRVGASWQGLVASGTRGTLRCSGTADSASGHQGQGLPGSTLVLVQFSPRRISLEPGFSPCGLFPTPPYEPGAARGWFRGLLWWIWWLCLSLGCTRRGGCGFQSPVTGSELSLGAPRRHLGWFPRVPAHGRRLELDDL